MPVKPGREYARLIRPTRNQAPTEYNLQYKRWPQHSTAITCGFSSAKGKLVKAGRIWSSSKPRKSTVPTTQPSTPYPESTWDSVTGKAANSDAESLFDILSCTDDSTCGKDLSKTLKTSQAELHIRPGSTDPKFCVNEKKCKDRTYQRKQCALMNQPGNTRKAWMNRDEEEHYQKDLQDDISAKLQCLSVYSGMSSKHDTVPSRKSPAIESRNKSVNSCKISLSDEALNTSNRPTTPMNVHVQYNKNPVRGNSYESLPKNTVINSPRDKVSDWRNHPLEDDDKLVAHHLKPGGKVAPNTPRTHAYKKRKMNLGNGIDVASLRKIYTEATNDELQKLARNFKSLLGSTSSRNSVVRNHYTTVKDEIPCDVTEGTMTKEESDQLRVAAFKRSQKAVGYLHKHAWMTSYNLDYCKKWETDVTDDISSKMKEDNDGDNESAEATEVKEHFKSNELKSKIENEEDSGENPDNKKKEDQANMVKNENRKSPKTVSISTPEDEETRNKRTASEAEKILKETERLEEREFRSMFREDGKPKMKFDTTSGQTYKGHPGRKPEEPVWANKTVVSLGSGHWNTLWEHYDGWEPEKDEKRAASDMVPKKRGERNKYKIKVYEKGEPCSPRCPNRNSVYGSYGAGAQSPRKTNVSFITEYMRKFTHMPLPKKHVRV